MVNSTGQVWPCCYLGEYEEIKKLKEFEKHVWKDYEKNKDKQNLNKHSLKEVLNSEWFTKTLPESWKDEKTTARQCKSWCTKGNDPAETRIKK
jgi:hypothetical protein